MKLNMGSADRIIRILIAVVIAVLVFADIITGTLATVLLIVAGISAITGLAGVCPLYMILGLRTNKAEK